MESNNSKTINDIMRPMAKEILSNGITEENCAKVINLLQSIIQNPYDEIFNDIDFVFLLSTLYYVQLNSPLLELLKNSLRDRFLYFQFVKMTNINDLESDSENWIVTKEILDNEDGSKTIVQYNLNTKTKEKEELSRLTIDNPEKQDNISDIFTNLLLNNEDNNEVVNII